ncbi:MAG: DUF5615 family PIN-like protein [Gaiellaceae bacterium]
MRLLLDEHYAKQIAEELRGLGHDVVCVTERPELVGLRDEDLLAAMASERRAILTENWGDFGRLLEVAAREGRPHAGVIFTSRRRLPRSRATIGLYVRTLDQFLRAHQGEDELMSSARLAFTQHAE